AFAPKFRERFSTKMLWYFSNGSIFVSEALFFFTGLIGGEKNGFYQKKLPMSIAFGMGNLLEMVFYATKGIVGQEINYEVLDYCEWKNGFRVEATINLINGYFVKIKDAILRIVNAHLLQDWAKYEIGETAIQTQETKWRLFLIAFGPHLIFDFLALLPMLFYNIDKETRERMYMDLEQMRARRAALEKELQDQKEA
ncbi:MAG: MFS transporter, partial [Clostridia bacterium]|nr:MFS transporter [Clostridia bacterium]